MKGKLTDLYWDLFRSILKYPCTPKNPTSFLFVCKGNICRSPFAEHLAKKLTKDLEQNEKEFHSGGLEVSKSNPPPEEAIFAADKFGIELESHRSKGISQRALQTIDMILTMEVWQFRRMRNTYPALHDKVFLLPFFGPERVPQKGEFSRYNIPDPYGKPVEQFYICFSRIEHCIKALFQEIHNQAS